MEKTTFFVSDQNFKDLISREFILTEKTSLSLVQCALDCQSMEHCKSFFFKEEKMACKLASEVIDSTNDITSSTGMKYFVDKSGKILVLIELCYSFVIKIKTVVGFIL